MERLEKISNRYNLIEKFEKNPVLFLDEKSVVEYSEVEEVRKSVGADLIYACDFAIKDIEGYEKDGYFQRERVVNIDHHSESANYKKHISSANLAIQYIKNNPNFLEGTKALTHHTDCDSILSTALMSGILEPEERFEVAAIAADHTGEANEIADLLQALKDGPDADIKTKNTSESTKLKYIYALEQLQNLLSGKELDSRTQELLQKRLQERELLRGLIDERMKYAGDNQEVAYLESGQEKFDATLLVGLLPSAKVIFTARKGENGKTIVNARLGKSVEPGTDLRDIMNATREPFGGRWNAGANKRSGGSDSSSEEIAQKIYNVLKNTQNMP